MTAIFSRAAWALVFLAAAAVLSGCNFKESQDEFILKFRNPEVTGNLDSLLLYGINQGGGDTLLILRWARGEDFPEEAPYPGGLGKDFELLVLGFSGGQIVRRTRTAVTAGRAGPVVHERILKAPELADTTVELAHRFGDSVVLAPVWKQRPGWQEDRFQSEGTYAWMKGGRVVGTDTVLDLASLAWSDSGTYLFASENDAGRDSMDFRLSLRHRIPGIAVVPDHASLAGQPLSIRPVLIHSDALLYRWMKGDVQVSVDSALTLPEVKASHAGEYRLEVRNVSDTTESARSGAFRIHVVGRLSKWDAMKWDGDVWW